jgi:hypothetical protein
MPASAICPSALETFMPGAEALLVVLNYKGTAVLVRAMKTYKGSGSIAPLILNLSTLWRSLAISRARTVYSRERAPYPLNRTWHGPQRHGPNPVWTFLEKGKVFASMRDSNPGPFSPRPSHYTDCDIVPRCRPMRVRKRWRCLRDFRLPPPCKWAINSSGMLRSVHW